MEQHLLSDSCDMKLRVYNTFFYSYITNPSKRHERRTCKPSVFDFDTILLPLNADGNHWIVVVICDPIYLVNAGDDSK